MAADNLLDQQQDGEPEVLVSFSDQDDLGIVVPPLCIPADALNQIYRLWDGRSPVSFRPGTLLANRNWDGTLSVDLPVADPTQQVSFSPVKSTPVRLTTLVDPREPTQGERALLEELGEDQPLIPESMSDGELEGPAEWRTPEAATNSSRGRRGAAGPSQESGTRDAPPPPQKERGWRPPTGCRPNVRGPFSAWGGHPPPPPPPRERAESPRGEFETDSPSGSPSRQASSSTWGHGSGGGRDGSPTR